MNINTTSSLLLSLLLLLWDAQAFTQTASVYAKPARLSATEPSASDSIQSFDEDKDQDGDSSTPPGMNPDRPELPELKGDFDWDAKFGGDDDWITDNVPGKVVLNEIELAAQVTALTQLEEKWRKDTIEVEYEESKQVGFVEKAETINGRSAMFFLVTGLLTEYWTGYSMPAQVEEMLRVGGFIGPDM